MNSTRLVGVPRVFTRFKRTIAYPRYDPQHKPVKTSPKDHSPVNRLALKAWLGPRNIRGEYYRNRYYYPPQNHVPNYITPNGQTVVDSTYEADKQPKPMLVARNTDPRVNPFPQNPACRTSQVIPHAMRDSIVADVEENGLHTQEAALKYGIKVARVDAIVRLNKVEKRWKQTVCYISLSSLTLMISNRLVLKTPKWLKLIFSERLSTCRSNTNSHRKRLLRN